MLKQWKLTFKNISFRIRDKSIFFFLHTNSICEFVPRVLYFRFSQFKFNWSDWLRLCVGMTLCNSHIYALCVYVEKKLSLQSIAGHSEWFTKFGKKETFFARSKKKENNFCGHKNFRRKKKVGGTFFFQRFASLNPKDFLLFSNMHLSEASFCLAFISNSCLSFVPSIVFIHLLHYLSYVDISKVQKHNKRHKTFIRQINHTRKKMKFFC